MVATTVSAGVEEPYVMKKGGTVDDIHIHVEAVESGNSAASVRADCPVWRFQDPPAYSRVSEAFRPFGSIGGWKGPPWHRKRVSGLQRRSALGPAPTPPDKLRDLDSQT